jgi:hypothetical protein
MQYITTIDKKRTIRPVHQKPLYGGRVDHCLHTQAASATGSGSGFAHLRKYKLFYGPCSDAAADTYSLGTRVFIMVSTS